MSEVRAGDPGSASIAAVYCDGVKLEHCTAFDDLAGWATVIGEKPTGVTVEPFAQIPMYDPATWTCRGVITIERDPTITEPDA